MNNYDFGVPGVRSERTHTPREVLKVFNPVWLPQGRVIDGSKSRDPLNTGDLDVLRVGLVMGKITSGGKYAPSFLGSVATDYASGATTLAVSAATAVELARRVGASGTFKLTHAPTPTGTVVPYTTVTYSAVNTSNGNITVTDIGVNVESGALLGAGDGSEVPLGILGEMVKVTDQDGTNIDARLDKLLIGGFLDADQIINYPAAANTTLRAWLKDVLADASAGPLFQFDDNF